MFEWVRFEHVQNKKQIVKKDTLHCESESFLVPTIDVAQDN